MGKALNADHIFNPDKLTKAQFKKKFTENIKAKGYTKSNVENASLCYAIAVSADRRWITVIAEDAEKTRSEAEAFAKDFDTQVLSVELTDSGHAEITLFDRSGAADTVYLGEDDSDEVHGYDPQLWQDLLGIDPAKIGEIQQDGHTDAEDALNSLGEVIGCENMLLRYNSAFDSSDRLFFKKEKKKLTIESSFKQVFGEKLIPMGFKFTGKRSFVRLVNNEVIQTVSCAKGTPLGTYGLEPGSVKYEIWFAISTVYHNEMLLKPDACFSGFETLHHYYAANFDIYGRDDEYARRIQGFGFRAYEEELVYGSMNFALETFTKVICPLLERSNDLASNLLNFKGYTNIYNWFDMCLLLDDYVSCAKRCEERELAQLKYSLEHGINQIDAENYDEKVENTLRHIQKNIEKLDEIYHNKDKYAAKMRDYENNRRKNLEILDKLGIRSVDITAPTDEQQKP